MSEVSRECLQTSVKPFLFSTFCDYFLTLFASTLLIPLMVSSSEVLERTSFLGVPKISMIQIPLAE